MASCWSLTFSPLQQHWTKLLLLSHKSEAALWINVMFSCCPHFMILTFPKFPQRVCFCCFYLTLYTALCWFLRLVASLLFIMFMLLFWHLAILVAFLWGRFRTFFEGSQFCYVFYLTLRLFRCVCCISVTFTWFCLVLRKFC